MRLMAGVQRPLLLLQALLLAAQVAQLASWLTWSERTDPKGCVQLREREHGAGACKPQGDGPLPPPSPPPAAPPAAPANRCLLLPDAAGGFLGQAHAIVQPQDAMLAAAAPQQASPLGRTHARGGGGTLVLCLLTHSPCLQVWVVPGAVAVVWACLMTVLGALLGGAVAGFGSVCRAGRPRGQCQCACGALGWMETGLNAQL
jgi:hypothetical protein